MPQQLELNLWQILAVAQTEPATVGFIELCGHLDGLNLVDLWLGLLLGDTGCLLRRQLSALVEFSVDFYERVRGASRREAHHQGGRAGIWIVELIRGEKDREV